MRCHTPRTLDHARPCACRVEAIVPTRHVPSSTTRRRAAARATSHRKRDVRGHCPAVRATRPLLTACSLMAAAFISAASSVALAAAAGGAP
eukprot:5144722-Prymnesium_polylepis.1